MKSRAAYYRIGYCLDDGTFVCLDCVKPTEPDDSRDFMWLDAANLELPVCSRCEKGLLFCAFEKLFPKIDSQRQN